MTGIIEGITGFMQLSRDTFYSIDSISFDVGGVSVSVLDIEMAMGFVAITIWGVHEIISGQPG